MGGWSTRELLSILAGLSGLHVIGADIGGFENFFVTVYGNSDRVTVEVSPPFDNNGETTGLAAAEIGLSLLALMIYQPVAP